TAIRFGRLAPGVWLVLPLLAVVLLAFDLPLIGVVIKSFFNGRGEFSLATYQTLVDTPVYARVLGNTFRIAVISTLCCALIGYPLAYWLRSLPKNWQMVGLAAIVIPFWISILVRTYAWIVIMGNAGIINRTLLALVCVASPSPLLYNDSGVIIATIHVLLPFLVLPLYASMTRFGDRLLQAGETLGASRYTVVWRIFFPLSVPALAAGCVLVF